jgi:hypothetical protein
MGMLNVAGGEYSDFYIYHLVMYIPYVHNNEFHTRAAYIIIWGGLVREMI